MLFMFFFFQAEDGIRDATVTGVQTCALPISHVGKTLQAKIGESVVEFFDGDALVKTHVRARGGRQTNQTDLPPDKVAFLMRTPAWCRKRATEVGGSCASLVEQLLAEGSLMRLREV